MTSRIAATFTAAGRPLLIPYLTAGWPDLAATGPLLRALEAGGADVIEIGVPFSDPSADGPVIQQANQQALAAGANLKSVLDAVADYRHRGGKLPIVLMGYANPFYRYGFTQLAASCQTVGVDAILAVDLPPRDDDGLGVPLGGAGVDRVVLIATTTPDERAKQIAKRGSGYIYYVALQGVTGSATLDPDQTAANAKRLRNLSDLPVAVGFGIRSAQDCRRLGAHFDAVIVGSRLLEEIRDAKDNAASAATALLADMREALT